MSVWYKLAVILFAVGGAFAVRNEYWPGVFFDFVLIIAVSADAIAVAIKERKAVSE